MSFSTAVAAMMIGLGFACVCLAIYLLRDAPTSEDEAEIYRRMLK